jgi:LCP family protein required for cell wall assembly
MRGPGPEPRRRRSPDASGRGRWGSDGSTGEWDPRPRTAARGRETGREPEPAAPPRRRRRSWRQRVILTALTAIVVLCLAGASVGGYVLFKLNRIDRVDNLSLDQARAGEPENYLIVAVDFREGQETRNTDTIMVARVDPQSERLALTSFPRDLMVTVADTGEISMINSAYSRPGEGAGEQNLKDTLKQNFGVPIHHFIEVNFDSFNRLVDAIGGVSMWFPAPVRDRNSGLHVDRAGCVQLDGQQALAVVRSRKMQTLTEDGWEGVPGESDLKRVQRQQAFVRRALGKAMPEVQSNPLRVNDFVNIAIDNVRFDRQLGVRDLLDLGDQFREFDPAAFETYGLPTLPYPGDPDRVVLDKPAAAPMLNVFRGLPPGELSPDLVTVQVLNATGKNGFARDISGALQRVGFEVIEPDTTEAAPTTTVQHAPGQANYGQLVARYLTTPAALVENAELDSGEVALVAGADFTTVHEQPTPIDQMPSGAGGQPAATSTTVASGGASEGDTPTTTTTMARPTTTTTQADPYAIGEPPPGQTCDS